MWLIKSKPLAASWINSFIHIAALTTFTIKRLHQPQVRVLAGGRAKETGFEYLFKEAKGLVR